MHRVVVVWRRLGAVRPPVGVCARDWDVVPEHGVVVALALRNQNLMFVSVVGEREQDWSAEHRPRPAHDERREQEEASSAERCGHATR